MIEDLSEASKLSFCKEGEGLFPIADRGEDRSPPIVTNMPEVIRGTDSRS